MATQVEQPRPKRKFGLHPSALLEEERHDSPPQNLNSLNSYRDTHNCYDQKQANNIIRDAQNKRYKEKNKLFTEFQVQPRIPQRDTIIQSANKKNNKFVIQQTSSEKKRFRKKRPPFNTQKYYINPVQDKGVSIMGKWMNTRQEELENAEPPKFRQFFKFLGPQYEKEEKKDKLSYNEYEIGNFSDKENGECNRFVKSYSKPGSDNEDDFITQEEGPYFRMDDYEFEKEQIDYETIRKQKRKDKKKEKRDKKKDERRQKRENFIQVFDAEKHKKLEEQFTPAERFERKKQELDLANSERVSEYYEKFPNRKRKKHEIITEQWDEENPKNKNQNTQPHDVEEGEYVTKFVTKKVFRNRFTLGQQAQTQFPKSYPQDFILPVNAKQESIQQILQGQKYYQSYPKQPGNNPKLPKQSVLKGQLNDSNKTPFKELEQEEGEYCPNEILQKGFAVPQQKNKTMNHSLKFQEKEHQQHGIELKQEIKDMQDEFLEEQKKGHELILKQLRDSDQDLENELKKQFEEQMDKKQEFWQKQTEMTDSRRGALDILSKMQFEQAKQALVVPPKDGLKPSFCNNDVIVKALNTYSDKTNLTYFLTQQGECYQEGEQALQNQNKNKSLLYAVEDETEVERQERRADFLDQQKKILKEIRKETLLEDEEGEDGEKQDEKVDLLNFSTFGSKVSTIQPVLPAAIDNRFLMELGNQQQKQKPVKRNNKPNYKNQQRKRFSKFQDKQDPHSIENDIEQEKQKEINDQKIEQDQQIEQDENQNEQQQNSQNDENQQDNQNQGNFDVEEDDILKKTDELLRQGFYQSRYELHKYSTNRFHTGNQQQQQQHQNNQQKNFKLYKNHIRGNGLNKTSEQIYQYDKFGQRIEYDQDQNNNKNASLRSINENILPSSNSNSSSSSRNSSPKNFNNNNILENQQINELYLVQQQQEYSEQQQQQNNSPDSPELQQIDSSDKYQSSEEQIQVNQQGFQDGGIQKKLNFDEQTDNEMANEEEEEQQQELDNNDTQQDNKKITNNNNDLSPLSHSSHSLESLNIEEEEENQQGNKQDDFQRLNPQNFRNQNNFNNNNKFQQQQYDQNPRNNFRNNRNFQQQNNYDNNNNFNRNQYQQRQFNKFQNNNNKVSVLKGKSSSKKTPQQYIQRIQQQKQSFNNNNNNRYAKLNLKPFKKQQQEEQEQLNDENQENQPQNSASKKDGNDLSYFLNKNKEELKKLDPKFLISLKEDYERKKTVIKSVAKEDLLPKKMIDPRMKRKLEMEEKQKKTVQKDQFEQQQQNQEELQEIENNDAVCGFTLDAAPLDQSDQKPDEQAVQYNLIAENETKYNKNSHMLINKIQPIQQKQQQQDKENENNNINNLPIIQSSSEEKPIKKLTENFLKEQQQQDKKQDQKNENNFVNKGSNTRNERYFIQNSMNIQCRNCQEYGHQTKFCSKPFAQRQCHNCMKHHQIKEVCSAILCFSCYKTGHMIKDCPLKKNMYSRQQAQQRCIYCKRRGHANRDCQTLQIGRDHTRDKSMRFIFCIKCNQPGHINCNYHESIKYDDDIYQFGYLTTKKQIIEAQDDDDDDDDDDEDYNDGEIQEIEGKFEEEEEVDEEQQQQNIIQVQQQQDKFSEVEEEEEDLQDFKHEEQNIGQQQYNIQEFLMRKQQNNNDEEQNNDNMVQEQDEKKEEELQDQPKIYNILQERVQQDDEDEIEQDQPYEIDY